ncbi:large subunit ribosomal protein L6 [Ekhidna lutea]|uniref:Large ribosomal subunit protein uL6 n=1 Tax=Ekhidna lutea TaxID=447679 RepID=A0A239JCJ1_EKHLU|nr:50S ribosomal protein L6 [Ekhidna lutea]SNT03565.1 large subunit ribosomal protein L6 [Ekhidna lutea]
MSRIGKAPINLPEGVAVTVDKNTVNVKGPKGELTQQIDPDITFKVEDGVVTVERPTEQKRHKALHGLYRSLVNNMVEGVNTGFKKEMELVGVGYKAAVQNNVLELNLGYSHSIYFAVPEEIKVSAETAKGQNPKVIVEGIDKQLVGQISAKIKSLRKVEPYKGKGIRFIGEHVRRKAGKTAAK